MIEKTTLHPQGSSSDSTSPGTPHSLHSKGTPLPQEVRQILDKTNYFKAMFQLHINMCSGKRIPPATQLVYRVLSDLANRNYWIYPFEASRDDLKKLTGIRSNDDIDRAKQRLKSLGYIDFFGKPNRFTIYCPPGNLPGNEPGHSATPHTPLFNTEILPKNQKERKKKERVTENDLHNALPEPNPNNAEVTVALSSDERAKLEAVIERCKRRN